METDFCPALNVMLTENRTVGRSGKTFDGLASNSTINNLRFIQRAMQARKPVRTLEIGLAFGASTLVFCSEHQRLARPGQKQHVAIDPFQRRHWYDEAGILAVERAGLADYLDAQTEFSEFVLPRLLEAGDRFDFIYVDGSHLFENVFLDAFYGMRLLNQGGFIAFDDCADPHVAKVIAFIRSNFSDFMREITPSDFKSTVARLLGKKQMITFECIKEPGRKWDAQFKNF